MIRFVDFNSIPEGPSYIFGTGGRSQALYDHIIQKAHNTKVLGFIDSFKDNTHFNDRQVINVGRAREIVESCTILISSTFVEEISKILELHNINDYTIVLDKSEQTAVDRYYEVLRNDFYDDAITNSLASTILMKFPLWLTVDNDNQLTLVRRYMNDIVGDSIKTIIDVGSYIGEEIMSSLSFCKNCELILACDITFEPYEKGPYYHFLKDNKKISLIKNALHNTIGKELHIATLGLYPHPYDDSQGDACTTNTIDNLVSEQNIQSVDWIKIGITGSEGTVEVVEGALGTIKQDRPQLSIWLNSHEALSMIPTLLSKHCPDYQFSIRKIPQHSGSRILTGIPKELC